MTTLIWTLVTLCALVLGYICFHIFGCFMAMHICYANGLIEDYLDGGRFDLEFIEEYDKYMHSFNPLARLTVWLTDMKEVRYNSWGEVLED